MNIRLERAYVEKRSSRGRRILVERLWPRGVSKSELAIDVWMKDIAPSTELRKWFHHDPEKWEEFLSRYHSELDANPDSVAELRKEMARGPLVFVFGSKEEKLNSAVALKRYLEERAG